MDIKEVQINVRYDVAGSTYNPVSHGFSVLNSVLTLVSQRRPLFFFTLPSTIMLFIGMVLAFSVLDTFNSERVFPIGHAMISMMCIIVSVLSIFTGITLNLIQRLRV